MDPLELGTIVKVHGPPSNRSRTQVKRPNSAHFIGLTGKIVRAYRCPLTNERLVTIEVEGPEHDSLRGVTVPQRWCDVLVRPKPEPIPLTEEEAALVVQTLDAIFRPSKIAALQGQARYRDAAWALRARLKDELPAKPERTTEERLTALEVRLPFPL